MSAGIQQQAHTLIGQRHALLATAHGIEQRQSAGGAAMPRQQAGPLGNSTVGEQPYIIKCEAQESLHDLGEIASCTVRECGHVYCVCLPLIACICRHYDMSAAQIPGRYPVYDLVSGTRLRSG